MKRTSVALAAFILALAGCGDDDEGDSTASRQPPSTGEATSRDEPTTKDGGAAAADRGTAITLGNSEFGTMLFDSRKQAIYIFERDPKDQTVCYGECAEAWPPVLTDGKPEARGGVKQSLLGTVERRDGRQQVTYAGKPLYFYAHEGRGEVRCHNVNLNGGLWWVIGPDGKRRP